MHYCLAGKLQEISLEINLITITLPVVVYSKICQVLDGSLVYLSQSFVLVTYTDSPFIFQTLSSLIIFFLSGF